MAKKSRDVIYDVSGTTDERGKVRNRDAEEASRGTTVKKKKKKKIEKREEVVVEDKKYKAGKKDLDGPKKKGKKTSVVAEVSKPKKKLKRSPITIEGESKEIVVLSKKTKGDPKKQSRAMKAIEEYTLLPPPVDEYDAEARRMFEKCVELAARLEEQMEDRIYGRDVYALNTVYNQIREIIADLRAQRDITAQVQELQETVLLPYHRVVGETIGLIFFHVEGSIRKFVKDRDLQEEIIKKLKNSVHEGAVAIQGEYNMALERIQKVLL